MPVTRQVRVRDGDVVVLVGTMKGAFIFRSNRARKSWEVGGPYFAGQPVYSLQLDQRHGRHKVWAGTTSFRWGTKLGSSDNFGKTWTEPETYSVKFPADSGLALKNIWQIAEGHPDEPNTLYCGVEPSALFKSTDAGETWRLVQGLFNHPHRPKWTPGGGGMCLHTIVPDPSDPQRTLVAMSTGGVYRTDDGGASWQPRNKGISAKFLPNPYPEFGQCVHKVVRHPSRPERLFAQNHWGVYRSDDAGDSWKEIERGVPSTFGFAMAAHPDDPDTLYNIPIESDEYRCTPEARLRVYRTQNAGGVWKPLTKGLPQKNALETVLRDALATDTLSPAGVYFGTRSGKVYGSSNEGDSWKPIMEGLPAIVSVKAYVVGDGSHAISSKSDRKPHGKRR